MKISPYIFAGLLKIKPKMSRKTTYIKERIIKAVKDNTSVSMEEIRSQKRTKHIVEARHLLNYCLRKYTYLTTLEVGKITNRDHSSVIHSTRVIENDLFYQPNIYKIKCFLKGEEIQEDSNIVKVKEAVLEVTGVSFKDTISRSKVRAFADSRHLMAYFLNKRTELNLPLEMFLKRREVYSTVRGRYQRQTQGRR